MNEDNKKIEESNDPSEFNKDAKEYPIIPEFRNVDEAHEDAPEVKEKAIDKLKKNPKMAAQAAIATTVIGLASFVVIATSGLVNVTMDAAFIDTEDVKGAVFKDDGIVYNISVSDVNKDNSLYFDVLNGDESLMKYTIEFEHDEDNYSGDLNGYFSLREISIPDLMKDTDKLVLDIHLCGDTGLVDRTYASYSLEVSSFTSVFNTVSYGCDCANSGFFKFQMDFVDDYAKFSSFSASITDCEGVVRNCTFTSDLHEMQSIFVLDLAGGDAVFDLSFKSGDELVSYTYNTVI